MRRTLLVFVLWLTASISDASAADLPAPWVELSPDGALSVRAIAAQAAACPQVSAEGTPLIVQRRGKPDGNFPVEVCDAKAPASVKKLEVGNAALPVLAARVNRIVVIGDTGCRLEGKAIQDCGDPAAWPFAMIAARAAARRPDLVIHLGDYYYRERACPADRIGCAGSPHGDNWPTWKAEVFDPAAPLLAAAPWVLVRGNHELCRRGGRGWFRLLDPAPARADCIDRTDPYWLSAGGLALLMFDSADADDFLAPPDKVAAYAAQLAPVLPKAPPHSWLLTHRPIWAMAQADLAGMTSNQTVQAAIRGQVPSNLDLVLSGHLHDFLSYEFGPERPPQLVVGTGGDTLLRLTTAPIVGAEIDGMPVRRGFADARFSYFLMERNGDGWDGTLYGVDDAVLARCRLSGRDIDCR
jgi:calcineurin-like phosphoesterase family protein